MYVFLRLCLLDMLAFAKVLNEVVLVILSFQIILYVLNIVFRVLMNKPLDSLWVIISGKTVLPTYMISLIIFGT